MIKNIKAVCFCCNVENFFSEEDINLASKPEGIECNQCGEQIKARVNDKKISRGTFMSTVVAIGSMLFALVAVLSMFIDTGVLIYYVGVPCSIVWVLLLINNSGTNIVMEKIIKES